MTDRYKGMTKYIVSHAGGS